MKVTKTLAPWLAALALTVVCCLVGRVGHIAGPVAPSSPVAIVDTSSPPGVLSIAGALVVLLGLVRQRHSA